jgi:hypothetical protein
MRMVLLNEKPSYVDTIPLSLVPKGIDSRSPQKSIDPSTSDGFFSNAPQIARRLSMLGRLDPR